MTQQQTVETRFRTFGEMTSWDAISEFGITRLAHYVNRLRNEGWRIKSFPQRSPKSNRPYSLYVLMDLPFGAKQSYSGERRLIVERGKAIQQRIENASNEVNA